MAEELRLTDMERDAALQLVQLSEGETTTTSAASPISSSCGDSVTFDWPEINNNSVAVDNVGGDNDEKKRKIRKEKNHGQKMKRRKEDDLDADDNAEEVSCDLMSGGISRRYRSIVDIYKATRPLIS